jgi:hypothetical protein
MDQRQRRRRNWIVVAAAVIAAPVAIYVVCIVSFAFAMASFGS